MDYNKIDKDMSKRMYDLTSDEVAKIFATYLFQKVKLNDNEFAYPVEDTSFTLCGIRHNATKNYYEAQFLEIDTLYKLDMVWGNTAHKLLLKPLSTITDKDAIDVASLTGMVMSTVWTKDKEGITLVDDGYELSIFFDGTIVMTKRGNPHAPNQCGLIDRLRELGYALPYKGKSLFDIGIAAEK